MTEYTLKNGVPKGIRTPVAAVKGQCPRPLDDGDLVSPISGTGFGGARRDRTADLYTASVALSQLSYGPKPGMVYGILTPTSQQLCLALQRKALQCT